MASLNTHISMCQMFSNKNIGEIICTNRWQLELTKDAACWGLTIHVGGADWRVGVPISTHWMGLIVTTLEFLD